MKPRNAKEIVSDIVKSDRSWQEDFEHENGQYLNLCRECNNVFAGHKRRIFCKKCEQNGKEDNRTLG